MIADIPELKPARLSGSSADWNIADLLRAASIDHVAEDPGFLAASARDAAEATWADTWDLVVRTEERLRRNKERLATLEAENADLERKLARQALTLRSRMQLLEKLAERAEAARVRAEHGANRAEARAAVADGSTALLTRSEVLFQPSCRSRPQRAGPGQCFQTRSRRSTRMSRLRRHACTRASINIKITKRPARTAA